MEENQLESPRKILEKLGELRKWQEEQEMILLAKQTQSRKALAEEKQKLYEMLGCVSPRDSVDTQDSPKESFNYVVAKKSSLITKPNQEVKKKSPVNKKPFLRRGEGLTSRFRVNPDHFNLKNIPKYKYSIANKKSKEKNTQNGQIPQEDDQNGFPEDEKSPKGSEVNNSSSIEANSWGKLLEAMNLDPEKATKMFQGFAKFTLNNSSENLSAKESNNMDDLRLFELLEEKLENSSFASNSSSVRRMLNYDEQKCKEAPEDLEESSESEEEIQPKKPQVRFCEKVEVNHFSDSSEEEDQEGNMVSTPDKNQDEFLDFKANLERKMCRFSDSGSEGDSREELMTKRSDELKMRLKELEDEIEKFRRQNLALTKEKQIHELSKVELNNRRLEMEDQINDERIKMEIYFHDERMKIADEKMKYEKLLKDFRVPTKKEREEVKKLKERVEELEKEVKEKTVKHGAAQSRHRSQVRNLEKEIKEQSSEIEQLKKENRKLEAENVRLRRQSNTKTLQEIKRNIAKLAPQAVQESPGQKKKKKSVKKVELFDSESDPEVEDDSEDTPRCDPPSVQDKKISNGSPQVNLKREIVNTDGSRDIWYPNGNLKKISADGMIIRMLYFNKDIKETDINEGTVKYYYAESNTWHTTYLDGLEILEYPNGETKHIHKDGRTELHFPNGAVLTKRPQSDGSIQEEWQYVDGTQIFWKNGEKVFSFPNGQREIHGSDHKRREYPEGTVKIVYNDGTQETRYSNGRVRLKDATGKLVMDSETKSYKCDS
ncbi:centromere protein J [Phlebotomus argentipes]|uniref:centromere protein J n=1 Tax=Phlebotomus argentipes TaxID=94469 RepID=UPI0028929ECB|nr:centromere protein J [Phlebotomus argentipes]